MAARLAFAVLLLLPSAACRTSAGSGDAVGALINVGVAATAAGVRRAQGECYTPCVPGTACNPASGLCDPLPCRGECAPTEWCEKSGPIEHCVNQRAAAQMQIDRPIVPGEPLLTPAPPAVPPAPPAPAPPAVPGQR